MKKPDLSDLEAILDVVHIAMVFKTKKGADQSINYDFFEIKNGQGTVKFHKQFNALQFGLKPINMLWYVGKDDCCVLIAKRKWAKIVFVDFEADQLLKDIAREQLSFKNQTFITKDRIIKGLI